MAMFRVGQRLRRVRDVCKAGAVRIPIGAEVVVTGGKVIWPGHDMEVRYAGRLFDAHSKNYEPIQPERNQVIEWSECLWQPEHMGEPV